MSGAAALFSKLLAVIQLASAGDPGSVREEPDTYALGGTVSGLGPGQTLVISAGDDQLEITDNGNFTFERMLEDGSNYLVEVISEPPRFDCEVTPEAGVIAGQAVYDLNINCETNASAEVFALDRLHRVRITMTLEEWRAFELDTIRANYSIRNASGDASPLTSYSHSEVYRQADFTYFHPDGTATTVEKVGFKMQGNTSRQYPIDQEAEPNRPRRFSFSVKFDEEFDEDESVYACIDHNGNPAAVEGFPCLNIVSQDLPEYPDADGREFMDVEKLRFRFNRDDPSYQREVLAHELLDSAGVPVARAAHARVDLVVTGTSEQELFGAPLPQSFNMGVFNMIEQIDKPFLKHYFDENGYLFKVGAPGNLAEPDVIDTDCIPYEDAEEFFNEDFCVVGREKSDPDSALEWLGEDNYLNPDFVNSNINGDGPAGNVSQFLPYQPTYDLKTKKKSLHEARAALKDFSAFVLSRPPPEDLPTRFAVPGFIRAQAMEIVLGAVDHYVRVANNYYLYFNEPSNRWIYIPTDFDYTLIDTLGPDCANNSFLAVCQQFLNVEAFTDIATTTAFDNGVAPHWAGRFFYPNYPPILWDLVFSSEDNRAALYADMANILDEQFDWSLIGPKLDERFARVDEVIRTTDAADAESNLGGSECAQTYNPDEIAGDSGTFCDPRRASIEQFVATRRATLLEEIAQNQ